MFCAQPHMFIVYSRIKLCQFSCLPNVFGMQAQGTFTHFQSSCTSHTVTPQIARFMWPICDPSGDDSTQVGSILAPWTLLSETRSRNLREYVSMHSAFILKHIQCYTTTWNYGLLDSSIYINGHVSDSCSRTFDIYISTLHRDLYSVWYHHT